MERILPPVMSVAAAKTVEEKLHLIGIPPTDRVVIAISTKEVVRESGLILPSKVDDATKKGTLVQVGTISDEHKHLSSYLQTGMLLTYGNYAGKKVEFKEYELEGYDLMVLSIQEIMYYEFQG